jgi:putative ABC transport system ATP-binding protein
LNLTFNDLKHVYVSPAAEPRPVLDIPSWVVEAGDQVLIKGISGSGKTTLFNVTAGLMVPTDGQVLYGDQDIYTLPEAARDRFRAQHIGYVFQNHYLLPTLTALENVVMPMAFAGHVPNRQWRKFAAEMLGKLGLGDRLDYRPAKLSTGQRLRVAIARAIINAPQVILADEPTAALDSRAAESVMDILQDLCHEHNAILLVASHDPALDPRFDLIANLVDTHLLLEASQPA